MRRLGLAAAALSLVVVAGWFSRSAASDRDIADAEEPTVKVAFAVVEGHSPEKTPLRVIIENTSGQPQEHFEEWNSWGYGNLTVRWTDAAGNTGEVAKVPGVFTRNFPSTVVLQPGEALVREISFDPQLWQGWPERPAGTALALTVTYRSAGEPGTNGWSGSQTSAERTVLFQ